jgi:ABC-type uncharacterized transport system permease subunit
MPHIALFLTISGLIVGLGAVTVIDWHEFLARNSSYWTRATISAHKVTKPLIWLGTTFLLIGLVLSLSTTLKLPYLRYQLLLLVPMVLNGAFLSFWLSPKLLTQEKEGRAEELLSKDLQNKIMVSMLISFFSWYFTFCLANFSKTMTLS